MSGSRQGHSRMSGSGQEAIQDVRECLGGSPVCPVVVGRPSQMSGSGRAALKDVLAARPDVRVCSGGPLVSPVVVMEALLDFREWSRGPLGCSGVVGRPSHMSGSGREALPYVRERSGGPPIWPGVVGRHSRMFGSGREALPNVR